MLVRFVVSCHKRDACFFYLDTSCFFFIFDIFIHFFFFLYVRDPFLKKSIIYYFLEKKLLYFNGHYSTYRLKMACKMAKIE